MNIYIFLVLQSIIVGIEKIKADVQFIKTEIREMRLSQNNNVANPCAEINRPAANMYMLKKKYKIKLPMSSTNEITTFDSELKNNEEFAKDFVSSLIILR